MFFSGVHKMRIDKKGRVSIPASFRRDDLHKLSLLEHPEYPALIARFGSFDDSEKLEALSSIFARHVGIDKDGGRILIPQVIRQHLELKDDDNYLSIIGMRNHFQIWSSANWAKMEPIYKEQLNRALSKTNIWFPDHRA